MVILVGATCSLPFRFVALSLRSVVTRSFRNRNRVGHEHDLADHTSLPEQLVRASCLCKSKSLRYYRLEGILCAPTAFGKTAVAAWLIAKRKVNTLVVVHRQQLLDQWQERLRMFLDLPAKSIGHIGGGKMDRTGCVDVAVIQSLYRKDEVKDFVGEYGQVIVE